MNTLFFTKSKYILRPVAILFYVLLHFQLMGQQNVDAVPESTSNSPNMDRAIAMDMKNVMSINFHKTIISLKSLRELEPNRDEPVTTRFSLSNLPQKLLAVNQKDGVLEVVIPTEGEFSIVDQSGRVHSRRKLTAQKSHYEVEHPKSGGKFLLQHIGTDGILYEKVITSFLKPLIIKL